ncbi:MAG: OmpA family protein [Bacteroidales bacterium]|nr:OmpA family protein [Bacteroidales bacterium]MBN2818900.1 OmpA family protein [Bacteroidales bacterium]
MKKLYLSIFLMTIIAIVFQKSLKAQEGTKITQTTLVKVKLNSVLHVSCNGDKKGAINIMVSGGVPPYAYEWSNGETTQDIAGLAAGTYKVKVIDSYGCPDSLTVEVKEPEKLMVAIDSVKDILCYGFNKGSIDVTISGGVPPYVYSWSDESSNQDLRNAKAGEYALLVTDANHCQEITSAVIKQNPLIVRSDEKVQNIECAGDSTGTIDINVKGGVPPYSYRWTSGEQVEDLKGLTAGTYTVQVTDSRGCLEAYSTKVTQPDPIILTLEEVRHISCAGDNSGAIDVKVKGGVRPYMYTWNDSLAFTQDIAGLAAGKYELKVQDGRNCIKTLEQEINEPDKVVVDITQVKNVVNFGESNGAIYIDVTGGVQPYKYEWSNGPKTKDVANIPANNYTCRITDANKCVSTISVNIEQPSLLEVNISHIENIKCFGERNGYINVDVKGGVPPYNFSWSNGDSTRDIRNLSAGTYDLTVTDAHGMVKTVKGIIEQPTLLESELQLITNNLCFGDNEGTVDINVKGGTPPYSYNWSNGAKTQDITKVPAGEYIVQIIDKFQCIDSLKAVVEQSPKLEVSSEEVTDIKCFGTSEGSINVSVTGGSEPYKYSWSNGAVTRDLSKLKAGQYFLKVIDSKGCDETLEVRISEPPLLESAIADITDVKCKNDSTGAIILNVQGGTAPYAYEWSNGQTAKDNNRIKAGSYSVRVVDSKGCVNTLSATVTEPSELYCNLEQVTNIDCFGDLTGAVDVTVGGGIGPYLYKWSNDASTQNLVGVKAGEYSLNVTDQNGCVAGLSATIVQNNRLNVTTEEIKHVACFGDNTGAVVVKVEGGVEPYSYRWSNGRERRDLSAVGAGNYTLAVSDARSCVTNLNITIEEPSEFSGEITDITQIRCHGDSNGVIITEFAGGVTPYTFAWNTSSTVKDISNLKAGTYTLIGTDKNGCTDTLSTVIEQPTKLELELVSVVNNPCFGERNGEIDVFVKGGVTPYTYKWSNGGITQDLTDLEAGRYVVHVTGATGCEKSLEATITEPDPMQLTISSTTDIKCFGGNNGAIDLNVTGGVVPYVYSWSNGSKTEDISELVAGSYTVNVVDQNGCLQEISAIINQPEPLVANLTDVKNINCFGDSTGAISIDVTGGTQPYQFKWNNGQTIEDISGLKIGDYSVEIIDAQGCSQNLMATITQPEELLANIISTEDVLCNGMNEGSIDISVKGGVTPYVYTWSNGSKEQDVSALLAGSYNVQIQDANSCVKTLEATINEPEMLVVSIADIVNIKEFGRTNGSIGITVGGGTSPYSYSWSNGATTQNIENLVAGDYSVIVLDDFGCRQDLNASIEQPKAIQITVDTINHIRCYGEETGFARVSVQGGVEPYTYSWSNGVSGNQLADVPSGEYMLTITDANNAKKQKSVRIMQPEFFELEIDSVLNPSCYELNNGMISTRVTGGTTPYSFAWNTGSTSQNLKGLTSGKFIINVTDARGCTLTDSTELKKPEALEVALLGTQDIECFGEPKGSVNIAVMGGTPPYMYNWNNGAKVQNLSEVLAGNYTVKVLDAKQCSKTISATVNEPPALVSRFATVKNVPCQGENTGLISTSVTGGTPPYNYAWSNGDSASSISNLYVGKYGVTITDSNGCVNSLSTDITEPDKLLGDITNVNNISCFGSKEGSININIEGGTPPYRYNWNNGSKEQNLTAVGAGDYSVNVTDDHGCQISLNASISQPTELVVTLSSVENIKCFGDQIGAVDVSVTGGVMPYSYSWSNGATTQDIVKIPAGSYTLQVADANGCMNILTATVEQPQPLVVENTSLSNNRCSGDIAGNVTMSVTGGVQPYGFAWSNGTTTRDLQNVPAGSYGLKVTDANGCVKETSAKVTEPPVLVKSIDAVNHIACNGESNGSIHISISGGIAPYEYQWSNGNSSQDLLNVPAGTYSVIIREGNGCESTLEATITEPTLFVSELLGVEHNNCFGDENGQITISAEGGTTPYTFRWNHGSQEQNLANLPSGDYSVLVSDANGCNRTIKTTIEEPDKLLLVVDSARNVKCCGDTSGAIFVSVYGGVEPYKYLWSHGKTTQDITGLAEGQYTVTVTDFNGCVVNTPEEGATIYEKIISQGKFVSRDILFDVNKATIKEASFIEISRIASFMKEHPQLRFSIEGHTDSQGDANANLILSQQRAESVKESLVKFGIDESRLETKGMGESTPVDTNATPEGRANNRRVEFIPL